jgi:hypothetical protein
MYKLVYYKNSTDKLPSEEYFYPNISLATKVKNHKQSQTTYGKWKVQAVK